MSETDIPVSFIYKALEKSSEAIIIYDIDGKVIQYNQSALDILGLTSQQLLGTTPFEPKWKCINEYGRLLEGSEHPVSVTLKTKEEVSNYKMGFMKPNDKISWILINSSPIILDEKISGVVITFSNQNDLEIYKDRFEFALNNSNIGLWDWDLKDDSLYLSQTWKDQLGYKNYQLDNSIETFKRLIHPKDNKKFFDLAKNYIDEKVKEFNIKFRLKNKNDEYIWIESTGDVIRNPDGVAIRFIGIHQDINNQMQNDIKLRQSSTIFEFSHDAIMISDKDNIVTSVNKAFTDMTGYTSEDIVGKNPRVLKSDKHDLSFYKKMWNDINIKDSWHGEVWNKNKSGQIYPEWLTIKVNKDSNGEVQNYIAMFSDMSELKDYEKKLFFESNHDSLTGLINRKRFCENLDCSLIQSARTNEKVALALMDLDKFKYINDTYGYDIGDKLLIEVAKRIKSVFRESDFVSRFGADEFGFILNHIEHEYEIEIILNRIMDTIKKPIEISENITININSSIGIALYPSDAINTEKLMQHAEVSMYKAKEMQSTFCFYDEKYTKYHKEQLDLYNDLKEAIKNKQISVHFQPQIDINNNSISGIEALARWEHPTKGHISPTIFIKICEDFGLIESLTDIVFDKSLKYLKVLQDDGYTGRLSLNVSSLQLKNRKIIKLIEKNVHKYDINPTFVEIEVSETAIVKNLNTSIPILNELKSSGFSIAIDDFCTGSASLMHLKDLNFDRIKIDKKLINNLSNSKKDKMFLKTVMQLCENMGYQVLIEGVETSEQLGIISSYSCSDVQGYIFSKPLSKDLTKKFIKENEEYIDLYKNILYSINKSSKIKSSDKLDMDIENFTIDLQSQYKELQKQTNQLNASKIQYQKVYEEFKTIFDLAPVGYAILNTDMQVENSNKYFDKLTQDVAHSFFNLYFNEKSKYKFLQWFGKLNDKQVKGIKLTLDDNSREVQLYGRLFIHNNHASYFISINDITEETSRNDELKKLNNKLNDMVEQEVTKNIKFQESYIEERIEGSKYSAIGQMSAGLTHEINTPLTIIKGNLEMLEGDIAQVEDESLKTYMNESLDKSYHGIDRISFIVNALREISDKDINPHKINVYSSLVSALTITHIKHKHVCPILLQGEVFSPNMDKNAHKFFSKASNQRLEQVWINIINNSLDELVKIEDSSKRKLYVDISKTSDNIIVTIKDNGGGIDENIIQNIFEPFVSTKSSSGIGLGMLLTKRILEDYNGLIKVENQDDYAFVTVTLPICNE